VLADLGIGDRIVREDDGGRRPQVIQQISGRCSVPDEGRESRLMRREMRQLAVGLVVLAVLVSVGQVAAQSQEFLLISEMMYNPYPATPDEQAAGYSTGDFEFAELLNVSNETIDLTGVKFTRGIDFDFSGSGVTTLEPGAMVLVGKSRSALELRYGAGLLDVFAGEYLNSSLADNGEQITLTNRFDEPIADFAYDDSGDWPGQADGKGSSLELINPHGVPPTGPARTAYLQDGRNWRASTEYGGSPGHAGSGPVGYLVVNEVLSRADPLASDWIELHNTSGNRIEIGGLCLSNSSADLCKFRIPDGTHVPAGGYVTFDEEDFNPGGGALPTDFALNGTHGDDVWLVETDAAGGAARVVDHVQFGAAARGESFGRWPNATGDLYPMISRTPKGENSGPRVGPVVVSEIMYNPPGILEDNVLEYVEIFNPTDAVVELTDWRIRDGIDFDFAAGTTIGPLGVLVIVSFDPDAEPDKLLAFRSFYGLDGSVQIVGGYAGAFSDSGEQVRLLSADESPPDEPGFIPRLLEDEVRYEDGSPWPQEADGEGFSLTRLGVSLWGNDPASWTAGAPTPGVIPEPSALTLMAMGGLALMRLKRR
jgi:hypothetical protein